MSPRFRSADNLEAQHLGTRVTIRRRLDDGTVGDVIGILQQLDDDVAVVRDRRGSTIEIPRDQIVASRVIRPQR